jgi:FkbM family methyltransferase
MRASQFLFKLYAALEHFVPPLGPGRFLQRPLYQVYNCLRRLDRRRSVVTVIDGITYDLDLTQDIDSNIYYKGCYEPSTTAFITRHVRTGMVALDIGANIGAHALRLAKLVGPSGRVIAFEPTSWAFARLQRNASLNAGFNLTLEKLGLGDFDGTRRTRIVSRMPLERIKQDYDQEDIRFMRLDDYLAGQAFARVDFIKLDVDGFDYKVLAGAAASLRTHRPLMIAEIAPVYLARYGDSAQALLELLHALAYEFSLEAKPARRLTTPPDVLSSLPARASSNVICWPPSR